METETVNDQAVGMQGDDIVVLFPKQRMTKEEALRLAAHLVSLADWSEDHAEFRRVLKAVMST